MNINPMNINPMNINPIPSSVSLTVLMFALCSSFNLASAQDEEKKPEAKLQAPEVVEITTKDRVILKCMWYPGIHGKETIPVLMLHDWGGSRSDLTAHAEILQKEKGFAVLVPDLRGHGESVNVEGSSTTLEPDKWKPSEIASMIVDIEACKKFLITKNNEGELNIDLLTLVAEGKTCIHAIQWSINDWQYDSFGGIKQGKDVKSLVLLAPEKTFRSLTLTKTSKHPLFTGPAQTSLSMLILSNADKNDKAVRESKSIFSTIERMRDATNDGEKYIHYFEYVTKKQVKVVENESVDVPLTEVISYFIANEAKRFANEFRWQDRSRD